MTDRAEQLARAKAVAEARRMQADAEAAPSGERHAIHESRPVSDEAPVFQPRPAARAAPRKGPSAGRILAACAATAGGVGLVGAFAIGAQASAEPAAALETQTVVVQLQVPVTEPAQPIVVAAEPQQAEAPPQPAPQRAPVTQSHGS